MLEPKTVTGNPAPEFSTQTEIKIKISYLREYEYLKQAKIEKKMKIILFAARNTNLNH